MNPSQSRAGLTRRAALAIGGGLVAAGTTRRAFADSGSGSTAGGQPQPGKLPTDEIEKILQASGETSNGVFAVEIGRKDLTVKGPHGITFKPSWQILHEFYFQSLGDGKAIVNGDMAMVADELNPVIDALIAHGIVLQSEHQHFYGLDPQVFHIHMRGQGDPVELARGLAAAVKATGAPLPQKKEKDPTTPLDHDRLAEILGGDAKVKEGGVVSVAVPRKEQITLGGQPVNGQLNVMSHIDFQPLGEGDDGKPRTAVAPDFAMLASEVNDLVKVARDGGFEVHCLYNQETDEKPQLFFSHQLAVGDAEELARVARKALEQTNSKFKDKG